MVICRCIFTVSHLTLTTHSISAMDTLSSNTAGVDAAKGKTLEEMSDLVQQVNSIHGITFLLILFF